jgi:hypothetical protein
MGLSTSISRMPRERSCPLSAQSSPQSFSDDSLAERPVWLWPNLLSLDAPLIAVLWLHLFAASEHIGLSSSVTFILGLTVWVIYVADRLFDGLDAHQPAPQPARHLFHRAHRNILLSLLPAALALALYLCFQLDTRTLQWGVSILLVVAGYFGAVHWLGLKWAFPKEAVVALVFAIGSSFPAWIRMPRPNAAMAISFTLFTLTCWLNVVLIEYVEWSIMEDGAGTPHASTLAAGAHLVAAGAGIAAAALAISLSLPSHVQTPVMLAIMLSAAALAALGSCWRRLSLNAVRVLADAALLTPAVILLFTHP